MSDRDHGANERDAGHDAAAAKCDPNCAVDQGGGPVRETGGTTGANNLSPMQANRTGGATSGVGADTQRPARAGQVPPSA